MPGGDLAASVPRLTAAAAQLDALGDSFATADTQAEKACASAQTAVKESSLSAALQLMSMAARRGGQVTAKNLLALAEHVDATAAGVDEADSGLAHLAAGK